MRSGFSCEGGAFLLVLQTRLCAAGGLQVGCRRTLGGRRDRNLKFQPAVPLLVIGLSL